VELRAKSSWDQNRARSEWRRGQSGAEGREWLRSSVSRFQEKEKRGEMITINENIK
jgi:hypothetical protein